MVVKTDDGWKCSICGEIYSNDIYALSCEQAHEIVYVPFNQGDLYNLLQFVWTKDESLLTESLMKTLMKYSRRTGN